MALSNESSIRAQQKLCGSVTPSCPTATVRVDGSLVITTDDEQSVTIRHEEALALKKFLNEQLET